MPSPSHTPNPAGAPRPCTPESLAEGQEEWHKNAAIPLTGIVRRVHSVKVIRSGIPPTYRCEHILTTSPDCIFRANVRSITLIQEFDYITGIFL